MTTTRSVSEILTAMSGRWRHDLESMQVSGDRVRVRVRRLFHVEVTVADPLVLRLTGWDRDLTGLIPSADDKRISDLLNRRDGAMASARRQQVIPAPIRMVATPSVGWRERRDAALDARREGASRRIVGQAMTAEAAAALVAEVWPSADQVRQGDDHGRERITVRPYGGNQVVLGISRRGILVVPVADGEGVPLPGGRSSITDGMRSQVLSALESADEWLRSSAPTDDVLALPVLE